MRNLTLVAGLGFFLPAIWLAYALGLGLGGVWAGLTLFIVVRLVGMVLRVRGTLWATAGAVAPDRGPPRSS
jgi:Na+-driven multidrug efflux pump